MNLKSDKDALTEVNDRSSSFGKTIDFGTNVLYHTAKTALNTAVLPIIAPTQILRLKNTLDHHDSNYRSGSQDIGEIAGGVLGTLSVASAGVFAAYNLTNSWKYAAALMTTNIASGAYEYFRRKK